MVTGAQLKRERNKERERERERERAWTRKETKYTQQPTLIGREKCHHNLISYVVDRTISNCNCTQHQILPT